MADKKTFHYDGKNATVTWDGDLCIHIGECGRAKGELFVGGRQPWCQPDMSEADEIREVIGRCPTGALSVEFADNSVPEVAADENSVQVAYNGCSRRPEHRRCARKRTRIEVPRGALPLRALEEQTLLRQQSRGSRISGLRRGR